MDIKLQEVIEEIKPQDIDVELVKNYMRIDFDDPENDKMLELFFNISKIFHSVLFETEIYRYG